LICAIEIYNFVGPFFLQITFFFIVVCDSGHAEELFIFYFHLILYSTTKQNTPFCYETNRVRVRVRVTQLYPPARAVEL
jgi:hypothetical protein